MLRPVFARRPLPPSDHAPCYPDWILLDTVVRGANHDWEKLSTAQCSASLATTARTFVDVRHEAKVEELLVEVEVSFLFATPPQVSGFIVHVGDNGLSYGAHVVNTDGDAVLLEITMAKFRTGRYFVYKAGRGNPPSLEVLPYPPLGRFNTTQVVGIVSHAEGYVVAAMVSKLYIGGVFSSCWL